MSVGPLPQIVKVVPVTFVSCVWTLHALPSQRSRSPLRLTAQTMPVPSPQTPARFCPFGTSV